ncbi:TetR/AcrR family transcriptional regulator [Nonomuraea sp. NPDC049400]|uniref:TetR/AcrR family transcriptional regulator n=1 Tax=Nonomuraea sp. NPDC049400 TaxID=3364352 RepID=UPI0037A2ACFE
MHRVEGQRPPAGAAVLRQSVTAAISDAAFAELAEVGYARMSMDAVARRAGVGKAALYRRWRSKEAMVTDLIAETMRRHGVVCPDTGTLIGDLEAYIRSTLGQLAHPLVARIVPDLVAEVARSEPLAAAVRESVATPRREAVTAMLQRAVERAELPADLDYLLAYDFLIAPLSFRRLLMNGPDDEEYVHRLAVATAAALKAACTG